ncbi:MAG: hypothetical protein ACRDU5_21020 [Mycobacterium sp.]
MRLRPGDLPVRPLPTTSTPNEAKTTRLRSAGLPTKTLPRAISAFDGKTVRLRPIDLPVIGNVAKTVRQRYADLSTIQGPPSKWAIARVVLVLALASMPILGISVDVFGLVSQNTTSVVVIALTAVLGMIITFAPHRIDMIVGRGLIAGMVACIVYDAARLFAVHVLGLMGDFIPVMGSWVTGEPDTAGSAAVGYVWRYIGDGGGLGVAFFVVAFALGIDRWTNVRVVLAAIGFAVFPTWAGLIATVALAPRGEEMMFPLNTATIAITLIGHLIFGLVLGLAFLKAPRGRGRSDWPWPPILESKKIRRFIPPAWRPTHRAPRA